MDEFRSQTANDEDIIVSDSEEENSHEEIENRGSSTNTQDGAVDIISSSDEEDDSQVIGCKGKRPVRVFLNSDSDDDDGNTAAAPKTSQALTVSPDEYREQEIKIQELQAMIKKNESVFRTVDFESLKDKGESIKRKRIQLDAQLAAEMHKLSTMVVKPIVASQEGAGPSRPRLNASVMAVKPLQELPPNVPRWDMPVIAPQPVATWKELQKGVAAVQPKTFGKRAMETFIAEKAITVECLHQLHKSLKTCPTEDQLAEDPQDLKVELMQHQKRGLLWLMWREQQDPSGGILADDMGLGKTLLMIALVLKNKQEKENEEEDEYRPNSEKKYKGNTLVVCPASLLSQWEQEARRRTRRGALSILSFHGPRRESRPKKIAKYDMVLTTYAVLSSEAKSMVNSPIYRINWSRIVLDEAHVIRNYKTAQAQAVFELEARSRWSLTGTPVHNREMDLYSQMKFLRCRPFDDYAIWKRWVEGTKNADSTGGRERMHTVMSSLMLRRTKEELLAKEVPLDILRDGWEIEVINLTLEKKELNIYSKVLLMSKTLFAQYLHQRAEKNQAALGASGRANEEYFKMRQVLLRQRRVHEVKQFEILVLILRLRQICCHPSLIKEMLTDNPELEERELDDEGPAEELDLMEQLNKMSLNDNSTEAAADIQDLNLEGLTVKEACKQMFSSNDAVFSKERPSSKIIAILKTLKDKIIDSDNKAIIVSQWTSFLNIIGYHLKKEGIHFDQLDGQVPVPFRMDMVDNFNNPRSKTKILLLSLTAGGVGLNLTGANHLFLVDLHWNPQLEKQAQDRVYRMGQKKKVYVYKFVTENTIEKRIMNLQEHKLQIADSMLNGKKMTGNKLTLDDLKMLFEMT